MKILLVTGSRSFDHAHPLISIVLRSWLGKKLVELSPDVVFDGAARGPDTWAHEEATERGIRSVRFLVKGTIVGGTKPRWAPEKDSRWLTKEDFLARDRAMVDALVLARKRGDDVSVLGMVDTNSETHGTQYTLGYAKKNDVKVEVWGMAVPDMSKPVEQRGAGTASTFVRIE